MLPGGVSLPEVVSCPFVMTFKCKAHLRGPDGKTDVES